MRVLRAVMGLAWLVSMGCSGSQDERVIPDVSESPPASPADVGEGSDASELGDASEATNDNDQADVSLEEDGPPPRADTVDSAEMQWLTELEPSGPISAAAHPSDALYDVGRVVPVAIDLDPADWDKLRAEGRTLSDLFAGNCLNDPPPDVYEWYPASVTVDGELLDNVGVRKKGAMAPLTGDKPSIKLRFDKFEEDRLLESGLRRMTLDAMTSDSSIVKACLTYHVFQLAGQPAPRCNVARVTVNGEDLGLYANVEDVRTVFLERNFGSAAGNLYEGSRSDFRAAWRGTFEKETRQDAGDWTDIDGLQAAVEPGTPEALSGLTQYLDVDRFFTFWALEALTGHGAGYTHALDNFYIYRPPDTGRFVFIPWGADEAFTAEGAEVAEGVYEAGIIANRLYETAEGRALYSSRMQSLLDEVWSEDELIAYVVSLSSLIGAEVVTGGGEAISGGEDVKAFIESRRAVVEATLAAEQQAPDSQLPTPDVCWEPLGEVEFEFSVTFNDALTATGGATFSEYTVSGEPRVVENAVATLSTDPALTPSRHTLAIDISFASAPAERLEVAFGVDSLSTGTWAIDGSDIQGVGNLSQDNSWEPFAQLGSGAVTLTVDDEQSTLSGQLTATLYSFGGYESGVAEVALQPTLVINELAAKGEPSDWFEVVNISAAPLDLSGFVFADDLDDVDKRVSFPSSTPLGSGEYRVFYLSSDDWPGFALGSDEELGIWDQNGDLVDSVNWSEGQAGSGKSFARQPDSEGPFMTVSNPTPGEGND